MIKIPIPKHNQYTRNDTKEEILELRRQFDQGGVSLNANYYPPQICHRDYPPNPSSN